MVILYALLLVIVGVWIYGFFKSNDLKVPPLNYSTFKNVLVIFPHPDDETLSSGGLIRSLTNQGSNVTIVVLTKGEKGNDDAHLDTSLKRVREKELRKACESLGVSTIVLEDFGDGELTRQKDKLKKYINSTISKYNPDLIITYDLSGLYGHADHIVTSEIITDFVLTKYQHISLLYPSLPSKILSMITLPEHMAKNPEFKLKRVTPTHRLLIGINITHRIRALYAYRSQLYSFKKSFPIRWIPLWFYYSMQLFEYYHWPTPRDSSDVLQ